MQAIIITENIERFGDDLVHEVPLTLLPLLDRPFIQHVIEMLIDMGIIDFHFVVPRGLERFMEILGAGRRWDCILHFHNSKDFRALLKMVGEIAGDEPVMFARADRLPRIGDGAQRAAVQEGALYCVGGTGQPDLEHWSGWAWLSPQQLANLPTQSGLAGQWDWVYETALQGGRVIEVSDCLSATQGASLLKAQRSILEHPEWADISPEVEREHGTCIERHTQIHPTATLIAPYFIGEHCRIGARSRIGPNVVLGANCVVEKECNVENALILPDTYIGEGLDLKDVIVDGRHLYNVQLDTILQVPDAFLIDSITRNAGRLLSFRPRIT